MKRPPIYMLRHRNADRDYNVGLSQEEYERWNIEGKKRHLREGGKLERVDMETGERTEITLVDLEGK